MDRTWTVYVLELEDRKYYVGRTQRTAEARFKEHQERSGGGSRWTEQHRPIRILRKYTDCHALDEDKYTKMYMSAYGIPNVRGGAYCERHLTADQIHFLVRELDSAAGKCYSCGLVGHVRAQCPFGVVAFSEPPVGWHGPNGAVTTARQEIRAQGAVVIAEPQNSEPRGSTPDGAEPRLPAEPWASTPAEHATVRVLQLPADSVVQFGSWSSSDSSDLIMAHSAEIPGTEPRYPWNVGYAPFRRALEEESDSQPVAWTYARLGGFVFFGAVAVVLCKRWLSK